MAWQRRPTKIKTPSYGTVFVGRIWKQMWRSQDLAHMAGFLRPNCPSSPNYIFMNEKTNIGGWAPIVSLCLGIASIILWELSIIPILAIIFGIVGLMKASEKKWMSGLGLVLGIAYLAVRLTHGHSEGIFMSTAPQEASSQTASPVQQMPQQGTLLPTSGTVSPNSNTDYLHYDSELGFSFDYPKDMFVMYDPDGPRLVVIPNALKTDKSLPVTAVVISARKMETAMTPLAWLQGPDSGANLTPGSYQGIEMDGQEAIFIPAENWFLVNIPNNRRQISVATLPTNPSKKIKDAFVMIGDSMTFAR
jgi:hypothetical protein